MPIVKGGFTPGSHGRSKQASFGRRVQYLASDHDRDKAMLLDGRGEEITRGEAVERFGGKDAAYFEVIYAPSEVECRALEERFGGAEAAQQEMARHLADRMSPDRPCLVAVHTHGERWHLHMPIQGEAPPRLLGSHGEAQRAWDEVLRATRPRERILDWDAHQRSEAVQMVLKSVQREQREVDKERYQAIRAGRNPSQKLEIAQGFDRRGLDLVVRRHQLEVAYIQARYEARGRAGTWDYKVEIEKVDQRRAGGENRIQRRAEDTRDRLGSRGREVGKGAARRTDLTLAKGREATLRAADRVAGMAERAVECGVDAALRGAGVPPEARHMLRIGMKVGQEAMKLTLMTVGAAVRAGTEIGMEVAPAAGRQAIHAAKVTARMSVGMALALPTAGVSLGEAARESGQDVAAAGKDLVQDGVRVGQTTMKEVGKAGADLAQEGLRSATSLGMEALPRPMKEAARAAIQAGKTAVRVATDVVRLDVLGAAGNLGKGGLDLVVSGARMAGGTAKLPEAVRMPLGLLEKLPVVGLAAKAAKVAAEVGMGIGRGVGLER